MSYEGYTQYLCPVGHEFNLDVHSIEKPICPQCQALPVLLHEVDETNGVYENDPNTFAAELRKVGSADNWLIDHHGNSYAVEVPMYEPVRPELWSKIEPVSQSLYFHTVYYEDRRSNYHYFDKAGAVMVDPNFRTIGSSEMEAAVLTFPDLEQAAEFAARQPARPELGRLISASLLRV